MSTTRASNEQTTVNNGTATNNKAAFDDVMLAMDIVDTLRHRAALVAQELDGDARQTVLIDRLKDIYKGQGIDVPERILLDGVKALNENRFVYEPQKGGLQFALARAYVARDRWLKPVGMLIGIALLTTTIFQIGIAMPRAKAERAQEIEITAILPQQLEDAYAAAIMSAETNYAKQRVQAAYRAGNIALTEKEISNTKAAIAELITFKRDLDTELTIRIISEPGEMSGVFRVPNESPNARNYYLIVESVDASGKRHAIEMESEEDRTRRRTDRWGVRTPKSTFDRVAADKDDDQIIQNDQVGKKRKGALLPSYNFDGAGGTILDW
ncbi:MAG: DUF6384 family protein [Pseudomonadota bacterium]